MGLQMYPRYIFEVFKKLEEEQYAEPDCRPCFFGPPDPKATMVGSQRPSPVPQIKHAHIISPICFVFVFVFPKDTESCLAVHTCKQIAGELTLSGNTSYQHSMEGGQSMLNLSHVRFMDMFSQRFPNRSELKLLIAKIY